MAAKGKNEPSKKVVEKQKQKLIEEKTFGLKNKNKSKTVQKYIQSVAVNIKGRPSRSEEEQQRLAKEKAEKKKLEKSLLIKNSIANAKKVLEKINNKNGEDFNPETILDCNDIDKEKLEKLIEKKHGEKNWNSTEIICKYFLAAVEQRLYGWRWECPNGETCIYKHILPEGFVLKPLIKPEEKLEDELPIEEKIELERSKLKGEGTKVTKESFMKWITKLEVNRNTKEACVIDKKKLAKLTGKEYFLKYGKADLPKDECDNEEDIEIEKYLAQLRDDEERKEKLVINEAKILKLKVKEEQSNIQFNIDQNQNQKIDHKITDICLDEISKKDVFERPLEQLDLAEFGDSI